ncbi:MAG TPA: hypothetical protein VF498_21120, partial [Anaerolineales bacterium]
MQLESLVKQIAESAQDLIESLERGERPPALGLRRAARLPVLTALFTRLQRPVLFLTDRADHALTLADELGLWAPGVQRLIFPEPTPLFYENAAWGEATRRDRLVALTLLAGYHIPGASAPQQAPLLIAPARALMTRTLPRREFLKATRSLKLGQTVELDELLRSWVALGYDPANTVIAAGQFARRGGILDLWPPAEPQPVRIEFFGDEIETLRRFDPATQVTIKARDPVGLDRILVTPAREFIADPGRVAKLREMTQEREGIPMGKPDGPGSQAVEAELPLSEFDIPQLHLAPASLLDYLPRQALVVVDDLQALQDSV